MGLLWNAFYFILAIGILVTIHEFGHFWVARRLGVKVLTFSIGFGKPIWQRQGKDGVNYVIAMIPLGGYVKMLGEQDEALSPEEVPYAFNKKSVWVKMAIVVAGPMANFILAIIFYWWMYLLGITELSSQIGSVVPETAAGRAGLVRGDIIDAVDGQSTQTFQDVVRAVAARIGEKGNLQLSVTRGDDSTNKVLLLSLKNWSLNPEEPDLLGALGIRHILHDAVIPPLIGMVEPGSPSDKAGLLKGDLIKAFDGQVVADWSSLVQFTEKRPYQTVELLIKRAGEPMHLSVVIGSREIDGQTSGYLGVRPDSTFRQQYFVLQKASFAESLMLAVKETGSMMALSAKLFIKLVTGELSPKSLSGPLSIAEGAGGSAKNGLVYFISFVAMISVNLGIINLLPIPMLDGGHLVFHLVEVIRGKPLSDKAQEVAMQIGMLLVFSLMAIAIFIDFPAKPKLMD